MTSIVLPNTAAADPSQIKSTSKPTTRADGSALVAQDIWNDTSSGLRWIYSGAVWRSAEVQFLPLTLSASGHNALPDKPTLATHIYFESYTVAQQSANMGTNNASNYINIRLLFREKASQTEVQISNVQNYPLATGTANTWTNLINTAYLISTYSGLVVRELAGAGINYAYLWYTPIVTFRWQFS